MNFEEKLKQMSNDGLQKEMQIQIMNAEKAALTKSKETLTIKTKSIIESVFDIIKEYYPKTSYKATHEIVNGKIEPLMGVFSCCFLEFKEDKIYGIYQPTVIGFKLKVEDTCDIKIVHAISKNPPMSKDFKADLLGELDSKLMNDKAYYSKEFNEEAIRESTQEVLIKSIGLIKANS
ncbi:hypothetical protein [Metaclostridioides mangenotii]|uniref:hypothetical protein n=1 Tax=Metaclostridioides mangenotii TaxID=1540 RepID=UPI00046353B6|nr:hypothetical protein [Clostridioides mangenotii]